MRRLISAFVFTGLVGACGGTVPSPAATQVAAASSPSAPAPTTPAVVSKPPPTQIPGCLPKCWFGQLRRPGALGGDYQTRYFFGGQMTVHVPNLWWGFEDSTGELSLGKRDRSDFGVLFALDLYAASDPSGTPDDAFDRSAEGVMKFIEQQQGVEILDRSPGMIGGLPGTAFEYRRAEDARNQDPDCPTELAPCIVEFSYPEWDSAFGEGGDFHSRIVIAKATWGGETHAVYAIFWADSPGSYEELADTGRAVIESAKLPDGVESAPLAP